MADGLTLADLLPGNLERVAEESRRALSENQDIGCMKLAWDYVGTELQGALKASLDCDLFELLAKGWAEARALSDYADPDKHPPGSRCVVAIGAHDVSREVKPVIAVTVGSCPCVELDFTFAVTAHFGGVRLTVADAHIVGGSTGEAWASAQLSYHGVPLHSAAESRKLALPGSFRLDLPGVPIPLLRN